VAGGTGGSCGAGEQVGGRGQILIGEIARVIGGTELLSKSIKRKRRGHVSCNTCVERHEKEKRQSRESVRNCLIFTCDLDGTRTFGFDYAGINHKTLKIKFLKN
jgi:hypothetical protein